MPSQEPDPEEVVTPFAVTNYRDIRKCFGIKAKNRRRHILVLGQTGTGKSTLIENMIASDMRQGYGVGLIDPHGDLAEVVLKAVPEKRIQEVIYFNPADLEYPVPLNPLQSVAPEHRARVASGIISIFKKLWPEFWGPRLEHILRYALLTLLEHPGSTLLDLVKLLRDQDYRDAVVRQVRDRPLRDFWFLEFGKYSVWLRSEAVAPILNKVGQLLADPRLRNIVGQSRNTFDFRQVMDQGKIVIANLSKGQIGEDACGLLGAILITSLELAALSRADTSTQQRLPFYLYIDEVQNFVTHSFMGMLAEARKYGLSLLLAHQYLDQLDDDLRAAVLGNAGTLICFRLGADDAHDMARQFEPVFGEQDLINLPNYSVYLKLMIDGSPSKPFSARTLKPHASPGSFKDNVIECSREAFGRRIGEMHYSTAVSPIKPPGSDSPKFPW